MGVESGEGMMGHLAHTLGRRSHCANLCQSTGMLLLRCLDPKGIEHRRQYEQTRGAVDAESLCQHRLKIDPLATVENGPPLGWV